MSFEGIRCIYNLFLIKSVSIELTNYIYESSQKKKAVSNISIQRKSFLLGRADMDLNSNLDNN